MSLQEELNDLRAELAQLRSDRKVAGSEDSLRDKLDTVKTELAVLKTQVQFAAAAIALGSAVLGFFGVNELGKIRERMNQQIAAMTEEAKRLSNAQIKAVSHDDIRQEQGMQELLQFWRETGDDRALWIAAQVMHQQHRDADAEATYKEIRGKGLSTVRDSRVWYELAAAILRPDNTSLSEAAELLELARRGIRQSDPEWLDLQKQSMYCYLLQGNSNSALHYAGLLKGFYTADQLKEDIMRQDWFKDWEGGAGHVAKFRTDLEARKK